jgi:hypothetical protein
MASDTPEPVIEELVRLLVAGSPRQRAAPSEALRLIDGPVVLRRLAQVVQTNPERSDWAVATVGRLSPDRKTVA